MGSPVLRVRWKTEDGVVPEPLAAEPEALAVVVPVADVLDSAVIMIPVSVWGETSEERRPVAI
jgi:hypothetical protein